MTIMIHILVIKYTAALFCLNSFHPLPEKTQQTNIITEVPVLRGSIVHTFRI